MPLYFFFTIVQKSQKWPKTQIKGGGGPALIKYSYPNPDPDLKTKEVPKVTSEVTSETFLSVELRAEITFISNIVSPMGVRRRLEALNDNSSKLQDHPKHLSPSTITPTLTLTLLKYPNPNLNPNPKTKAFCKNGQLFGLSRT